MSNASVLDNDYYEALRAYRDEHGPVWQMRLTNAWLNDWAEQRNLLRTLRNDPTFKNFQDIFDAFDRTENIRAQDANAQSEAVGRTDDSAQTNSVDAKAALRELIAAHGLTFSDCVDAFAAQRDEYDLAAVRVAADNTFDDGPDIDGNAITSRGADEDGCYVMAWRWVDSAAIEEELEIQKSRSSQKTIGM